MPKFHKSTRANESSVLNLSPLTKFSILGVGCCLQVAYAKMHKCPQKWIVQRITMQRGKYQSHYHPQRSSKTCLR